MYGSYTHYAIIVREIEMRKETIQITSTVQILLPKFHTSTNIERYLFDIMVRKHNKTFVLLRQQHLKFV